MQLLLQLIGQRGEALDRAVTFRDLVESGLAKTLEGFGGRLTTGQDITDLIEPGDPRPNRTVPPRVRNLKATGGVGSALVTWDQPQYANHAFTEIARGINASFGSATVVGSSPSRGYSDRPDNSGTTYYWARHVSTADVAGPWAGPVTAEVAETAYDILKDIEGQIAGSGNDPDAFVIAANKVFFIDPNGGAEQFDPTKDYTSQEALEQSQFVFGYATVNGVTRFGINVPAAIRDATIDFAKIDLATVNNLNVTELATFRDAVFTGVTSVFNIEVEERGLIKSADYAQGAQGFLIREDGFAEFNGVTVRGTVDASTVTGSTIIGGRIISADRVIPTDLDSGNNVFLASVGQIVYRESRVLPITQPTGNTTQFVVDIASANNSNTLNTRRYKSTTVPIRIDIFASGNRNHPSLGRLYLRGFEVRVFRGQTPLALSGMFTYMERSGGFSPLPGFTHVANPETLGDGFFLYAEGVSPGPEKYEIRVNVQNYSGDDPLIIEITALRDEPDNTNFFNFLEEVIIEVESVASNQ